MAWTKQNKKTWRKLLCYFKRTLPSIKKVHVRRIKLPKCRREYQGYVIDTSKAYYIFIDKTLTYDPAIDTLIEEWAHTIAGFKGGTENELEDHGAAWGRAVSKVKQAYLKF